MGCLEEVDLKKEDEVKVTGWASSVRANVKGRVTFVSLNDGSSTRSLQIVLEKDFTSGYDSLLQVVFPLS